MQTTSLTLLQHLRQTTDQQARARFVRLYSPLLYHWLRRCGLQDQDALDCMQQIFLTLMQKLPEFERQPQHRFRGWLWTITLNKAREFKRRLVGVTVTNSVQETELATPDTTEDVAEAEYRNYLVGRALQLMQADFQPATWKACWACVVEERPADEVARELGLSVNAVYLAKVRVLNRLRAELSGLLDD